MTNSAILLIHIKVYYSLFEIRKICIYRIIETKETDYKIMTDCRHIFERRAL